MDLRNILLIVGLSLVIAATFISYPITPGSLEELSQGTIDDLTRSNVAHSLKIVCTVAGITLLIAYLAVKNLPTEKQVKQLEEKIIKLEEKINLKKLGEE